MHSNHLALVLASLTSICLSSQVEQTPLVDPAQHLLPESLKCDCTGTNDTGINGKASICRDPRLGPVVLPNRLPLLSFVSDYDRFGSETPANWLKRWTDAKGAFKWPPHDGFQLNTAGEPILGNLTLEIGTKLDRFGRESGEFPQSSFVLSSAPLPPLKTRRSRNRSISPPPGAYLSAADSPYAQRALPPSSLACDPQFPDYPYNYHVYEVAKPFRVVGGPIAPWFGQPGLGAQFNIAVTARNITTLLEQGYLTRVNKSEVDLGPGPGNRCELFSRLG
ncbi:hypothetical protein MMC07_008556 [Pseudocyphellaria aurata]|nr:hypothetical protein [Pseudocyphellaria aurata]